MDFLKNQIRAFLNSRMVQKRFRFPTARTLKIYALVITALALLAGVQASFHTYAGLTAHGATAAAIAAAVMATIALNIVAFAIMAAIFLVMWCLYYRLGTDISDGLGRFLVWAPKAYNRFRYRLQGFLAFLAELPGVISAFFGRLGRGIARAYYWLADRPYWWRTRTGKQRSLIYFNITLLAVYTAILVAFFPVAGRISAAAPSWAPMHDAPLLRTLYIDLIVGVFGATLLIALLAGLVASLLNLRKK